MNGYKNLVNGLVDNLGYTVVRVAPLLAALPALAKMLEAAGYSVNAWITVVGIELTGYALGELTVRSVRKGVFTWRQVLVPLGIYGIVIEGMLLGYDTIPTWVSYMASEATVAEAIQATVSIFLPFFTLSGAGMFALHEYLEELKTDEEYDKQTARNRDRLSWEDDRNYKQAGRDARLAAKLSQTVSGNNQKTVASPMDTFAGNNQESVGKQIVRHLIVNPGAKLSDIASTIGCTVSTVSKEVSPLVDSGVLDAVKEGRRKILTVNGNHEEYLAKG